MKILNIKKDTIHHKKTYLCGIIIKATFREAFQIACIVAHFKKECTNIEMYTIS